jgi:tetratricopeptide (TPR) repeat protein
MSLSGFIGEAVPAGEYPVMRLEETSLHFRRLPPHLARASLMSHRSYLFRCTGRFDEARLELDDALAIVRAHGNPLDVARLIAQRGALETRAGDLETAERWLEASLDLRQRLREHRGILLTLSALAIVAALKGEEERSRSLIERAARMGSEADDGPGMGGVLLAQAEIHRNRGEFDKARDALDGGLAVFYGVTGLLHYASWVHVQHAYLSLELGDFPETERRLDQAWSGFEQSGTALGMEHCRAIGERLRAANGMLTRAEWSRPSQQPAKEAR